MLVFDESHRSADYSQRNEVVLRLCLCQDGENLPGRLIKRLDCREHFPVRQRLRFAQNAFRSVLIDVEAKDLPAKLALDDHRIRGLLRSTLCNSEGRESSDENQDCSTE